MERNQLKLQLSLYLYKYQQDMDAKKLKNNFYFSNSSCTIWAVISWLTWILSVVGSSFWGKISSRTCET
jgi:hypothetical protein